eukprot:365766-Chlamydomonas_euryale.AAC.11
MTPSLALRGARDARACGAGGRVGRARGSATQRRTAPRRMCKSAAPRRSTPGQPFDRKLKSTMRWRVSLASAREGVGGRKGRTCNGDARHLLAHEPPALVSPAGRCSGPPG